MTQTGFSAQLLGHLTEASLSTFKTCCYAANSYLQNGKFASFFRSLSSVESQPMEPSLDIRTVIENLPPDWLAQISGNHSIWQANCSELSFLPWKESYVSADSFSLNKRECMSSHHRTLFQSLMRNNRTNKSLQFLQKRHFTTSWYSLISKRELKYLEQKAQNDLNDVSAQLEYLKEVVKVDPEHAIRWYEKKCAHLSDPGLGAVYTDALYATGRRRTNYSSSSAGAHGFTTNANIGTEDAPLYVKNVGPRRKESEPFNRLNRLFPLKFIFLGILLSFLFAIFRRGSNSRSISPSDLFGSKDFTPEKSNQTVRFDDVQGCDEAKEELQQVVQFLQNPEKFEKLGAKIPCGVLLVGPPGCGKTLLARAIAGEADVPFFFVSGSEFDEMFVGVGASRIRKLFQNAKESAPSIIFIDELDAVGGKRNITETNPYSRMTLNQLLEQLDGFKESQGVIVVGATNFAEVLDTALTRPGRFDSQVHVSLPDVRGRIDILNLYIKKVSCADDVDMDVIARSTPGFTGADLSNLVNQAALRAASLQLPAITMEHFDWARDKIIMGPERRSAVIEQNDRKVTAYHESGHAVVAYFTKDANPPHKATIIPRGNALGYVMRLPQNDELSQSRKQLLAEMDVCMGGRVAEELIFGEDNITTGASSDMQQASSLARAMVTRYGMSDKVGTVTIDEQKDNISPELQNLIESEVKRLLQESYIRAKTILQKHRKEHKILAEGLLKYETLTEKEIELILKGKSL